MATTKIIILCAIISVAMSFTIPENEIDDLIVNDVFEIVAPFSEDEVHQVHTRNIRSPDNEPMRRFEARGEHHSRFGESAGITYTHPVGKNIDIYGGASRNFKFNENRGHAGIRYKF